MGRAVAEQRRGRVGTAGPGAVARGGSGRGPRIGQEGGGVGEKGVGEGGWEGGRENDERNEDGSEEARWPR